MGLYAHISMVSGIFLDEIGILVFHKHKCPRIKTAHVFVLKKKNVDLQKATNVPSIIGPKI